MNGKDNAEALQRRIETAKKDHKPVGHLEFRLKALRISQLRKFIRERNAMERRAS